MAAQSMTRQSILRTTAYVEKKKEKKMQASVNCVEERSMQVKANPPFLPGVSIEQKGRTCEDFRIRMWGGNVFRGRGRRIRRPKQSKDGKIEYKIVK